MHSPTLAAAIGSLLLLAPAPVTQDAGAGEELRLEVRRRPAGQAEAVAVLPAPAAALAMPGDAGSLDRLLVQLAEASGVHLVFDADARELLAARRVVPEPSAQVAPDQAWSALESLLFVNDIALYELRATEPRMLLVTPSGMNPALRQSLPHRLVPEEELPRYADHHALRIQSALVFQTLDARQTANAMRAVSGDGELDMIAPNEHGLVIRGSASRVASTAALLQEMDRRATEQAATQATQPAAGGDGAQGGD